MALQHGAWRIAPLRTLLSPVRCISSLYIPGNVAAKINAFVEPDVNFDARFADPAKLQHELNLRDHRADVGELHKLYRCYKRARADRLALEERRASCKVSLEKLQQVDARSQAEESELEGLETRAKLLREDLKVAKSSLWEMEEGVLPRLLKLPNELDERTPHDAPKVLKSVGEKPSLARDRVKSHLELGVSLDLVDYRTPVQYYLSGEAARCELALLSLASHFMQEARFTRVSGPDFCRSVIVEGSGLDQESPRESFILRESEAKKKEVDKEKESLGLNKLHLVGGASLPALLAPYAKLTLPAKAFPVRVYSSGRQYSPVGEGRLRGPTLGLFGVSQSSAVQALSLLRRRGRDDVEEEEYTRELEEMANAGESIYEALGSHYRVVARAARELQPWESLRLSYEMWSCWEERYVEVGYVAACGDYFGRRLMIGSTSDEQICYAVAITGAMMLVPRVLACLMEENPERFVVPECLGQFARFEM